MARRQFQDAFPDVYFGSETKNFGSLADKAEEEEDVTVTGAALGDFALASLGVDTAGLTLTATVTAANVVTCVLNNTSGGTVDLASSTLKVCVLSPRTDLF